MTLPAAHVVLLDAQTARKATELAAKGSEVHLAGLTAHQAATIAAQLRRIIRPALTTANRLDRHAAELSRQDPP